MPEGGPAPGFCCQASGSAAFPPKRACARARFRSANWGRSVSTLRLGTRSGAGCACMRTRAHAHTHTRGLCQRSALPRVSHQVSGLCAFPRSDTSARSPSHSTLRSSPRITSFMKPSSTTPPHPAQSALLVPPGTFSVPDSISAPVSAGSLVPRPQWTLCLRIVTTARKCFLVPSAVLWT